MNNENGVLIKPKPASQIISPAIWLWDGIRYRTIWVVHFNPIAKVLLNFSSIFVHYLRKCMLKFGMRVSPKSAALTYRRSFTRESPAMGVL